MIETFKPQGQQITTSECDHCGEITYSQAWTIKLDRPLLQRRWVFCSLPCLRKWAKKTT